MSTTRRKFNKEFKAKVVLESLKERETLESLAKKYELQPAQISAWKTLKIHVTGLQLVIIVMEPRFYLMSGIRVISSI